MASACPARLPGGKELKEREEHEGPGER